ncbi:hypothetical protein DVH24_020606 [Malus domestica]|uniref:Uncharacterized protein n=1 Tax=Malus domestica TaxID=3750 RepID=A0A498JCQ5_MALDO|nr:hypothetical protein DVH24_020606 [Malus domestica]
MEEIGPVKGSMKQRLHPGMLSSQDHATAHYSAFTGLKVTEDGMRAICGRELYTGGNDRQILVWSLPRMVSDEDKGPSKDGDNWSN